MKSFEPIKENIENNILGLEGLNKEKTSLRILTQTLNLYV